MCVQIIAGVVTGENITGRKRRTCIGLQSRLEVKGGEKCTFESGGGDYEHIFYLLNNLNFKIFWEKETNAVLYYS